MSSTLAEGRIVVDQQNGLTCARRIDRSRHLVGAYLYTRALCARIGHVGTEGAPRLEQRSGDGETRANWRIRGVLSF